MLHYQPRNKNPSKSTRELSLSLLANCGHRRCQTESESHQMSECTHNLNACDSRPPTELYKHDAAAQTSTMPGVPVDEEAAAAAADGLASRCLPAKMALRSDNNASLRASSLF